MHKHIPPRIHVFSDFDATITLRDTGTTLIDHPERGMGKQRRLELEHQVMEGIITYRQAVQEMWDSVTLTWEEADELYKEIEADPDFSNFYHMCERTKIPLTVVSSGLRPIIDMFMHRFLGEAAKSMDIISNHAKIGDRKWQIIWNDDSEYGNDKSIPIKKVRESLGNDAVIIFVGDGISDVSAAKSADILFARHGLDLEKWCKRERVPFRGFSRFGEVEEVILGLLDGRYRLSRPVDGKGFCELVEA
ncbi:uncharacterized protein VTP21DRAFT_10058 [Calcarisporiella thermophila]|uniref:uncharacterized protein n=1 Tax=Calcarisporiella thermophila TaxID=911321 RepID=UPI0037435DD5